VKAAKGDMSPPPPVVIRDPVRTMSRGDVNLNHHQVRLIIEKGGRITITEGYAWNGCSPKMPFLDLLIGTPDGAVYKVTGRPKAYFASLVHDALYQFLDAGSPVSRRQADDAFLRLLQASRFRLAWIYWAAVRVGGWMVWKATDVKREWNGTAVRADNG
jgi:hypothetical protein